jgi:hypothetical protein
MSRISTKEFVEKLYTAHKKNQSLESFAKDLGISTKQAIAKRNNINGGFSKTGKEIRLPNLRSNPSLTVDELAALCEELSKSIEKKPRKAKTLETPQKDKS